MCNQLRFYARGEDFLIKETGIIQTNSSHMCCVIILIRSTPKIYVVTRHHYFCSRSSDVILQKPVVMSRNVGRFLKLKETILQNSMSVFVYFYIRYFIVIGNPIHSIEASSLCTLGRNIKHLISKP